MTPTELTLDSNSEASEEKSEEPERWPRGEHVSLGDLCRVDATDLVPEESTVAAAPSLEHPSFLLLQ